MGKNRTRKGVSDIPEQGGRSYQEEEEEYEEFTTENGKHTIQVREVNDPREFLKLLRENKEYISDDKKWRVDAPVGEKDINEWIEYHPGVKMYVTPNGTTGAVTPDGDMIALSSGKKGEGAAMFEWQIQHGGRFLDSYDGNFGLYRHLGFKPVSYTPFNREYASGWDPEINDPEDVVFMVYGGKGAKSNLSRTELKQELADWKKSHAPQVDSVNPQTGKQEWGYDKAEQERNKYLEEHTELQETWKREGL